jgi:signal transduction histidine kinase
MLAAIVVAGWSLADVFRQHVAEQFRAGLTLYLDQLTANLSVDDDGRPRLATPLNDPRLARPYSGLYWQVDLLDSSLMTQSQAVLRSRSLWDAVLTVPDDALATEDVHQHHAVGPDSKVLGLLERVIYPAEQPQQPLRIIVAADTGLISEPVEHFQGLLAWSLGSLGLGLGVAVVLQVLIGLRPLGELGRALGAVREGQSKTLQGQFPVEIQPLVDGFNAVLAHNEGVVNHARVQAGNLAHAVKTPLTILANAAEHRDENLPQLVAEQVQLAQRQVDYHLAKARAAAVATMPGVRSELQPVLDTTVRVLQRLYHDKHLTVSIEGSVANAVFRGDQQDLQEMLGNVLDNAWKWAKQRVNITVSVANERLLIAVDDDGPGLAAAQRQAVLVRGTRADERVPGTGLGLAIVDDLTRLYEGGVTLSDSPLGGLRVELVLPSTLVSNH